MRIRRWLRDRLAHEHPHDHPHDHPERFPPPIPPVPAEVLPPAPLCMDCLVKDARIVELEARIKELEQQVQQRRRR